LTKNCLRGVKLDKTMRGHKKKPVRGGVKNPVLCPRGVRKIPFFVQGVEKIPIMSEWVTENFLPPLPVFLME